jgi:hypothetical protein
MSVDAQRLMDILTYINMLWSAPYQISLAIFFLYRTMGISVLAGVAVMLVLFPLNFFIGRRMRKFQVQCILCISYYLRSGAGCIKLLITFLITIL